MKDNVPGREPLPEHRYKLRRVYLAAATVFLVTAWFSTGYNHFDEHFQVLEFAGLKLGLTAAANLPWEYGVMMRPAIQPGIVFLLCKCADLFGFTDPFGLAFLIRLLSAAFTFLAIHLSIRLFAPGFRQPALLYAFVLISFFTWFVPYNAARFSSETFAGRIILAGMAWFFLSRGKGSLRYLLAGAVLGAAFITRYQTAFIAIGFGAWLVFINRAGLRRLAAFSGGFITVFLGGILIDRWFYGRWVLTSWNYYEQNMVLGKAAGFGTSPWWYYLEQTLVNAFPPLSILLILGVILYFIFFPRDWITWMFVPFLLAHFLIGHKEIRFLFPIIGFLPVMVIRAADRLLQQWNYAMLDNRGFRISVKVAWALNLFMVAILMFRPADDAMPLYRQLWTDYSGKARLCFTDDNPYHRARVDIHFYKRQGLSLDHFDSLNAIFPVPGLTTLLVTKKPLDRPIDGFRAVTVYETYPAWVRHFNINDWMARTSFWHVYELHPVSP